MTGLILRRGIAGSVLTLILVFLWAHDSAGHVAPASVLSREILSGGAAPRSSPWAELGLGPAALVAVPVNHGSSGEFAEEQKAPRPRIQFEEDTWDFGTIYQSAEVSHAFVFHNTGDAVLEIGKVRSTCGCTAALLAEREIAPGQKGEIKLTFRSGTMRGRVVKHVYVGTNDPLRPRVDLRVTGEVKVEVEAVPHGIYIGKLEVGEAIERSIALYSPEVPSFRILEIYASHPALRVGDPVKLAGQQGRYRLNVQFGPVEEPGRVNAKITLHTDLPHTKKVVVRVYGKVVERGRLGEPAETH
ncbi:MAG: DUF1573 domain-containing protein [Armatimonadota bacterium]|nr:MAG: DUF1573 domain-containing protein [Armatimonadota bacterium]